MHYVTHASLALFYRYPFGMPDESNPRDKKAMMTRVRP